jgi:signal transduction histidine kinase
MRRGGGTGLGLAIVRELALAQGGNAWYEAGQLKGSTFGLRLRAVVERHNAGAEPAVTTRVG